MKQFKEGYIIQLREGLYYKSNRKMSHGILETEDLLEATIMEYLFEAEDEKRMIYDKYGVEVKIIPVRSTVELL